jgi:predicted alpha/beta hydrolase
MGTRFRAHGTPRGVVLFAAAMAVPQGFYAAFASHLAAQGFECLTFDYRGIGLSLGKRSMRAYKHASITEHWVNQDFEAAVRTARALVPHAQHLPNEQHLPHEQHLPAPPLFVLGHSLGGQVLPLLPSRSQVRAAVNIAVGSGTLAHNTPSLRKRARWMWRGIHPLLVALFGYFPGKRLGIIGDLPSGPMAQWKHWCLTPEYILTGESNAREAYATATYPLLAYTFTDDELLLPEGSRMLHQAYRDTKPDYRETSGAATGQARIGHFGFFRQDKGGHLWPTVTDWLVQQSHAAP